MEQGDARRSEPVDVWAELRKVARHAFPNPERKGCPCDEVLRKLAFELSTFALDDPLIDHVATCSPCLNVVWQFRQQSG